MEHKIYIALTPNEIYDLVDALDDSINYNHNLLAYEESEEVRNRLNRMRNLYQILDEIYWKRMAQ